MLRVLGVAGETIRNRFTLGVSFMRSDLRSAVPQYTNELELAPGNADCDIYANGTKL